MRKQLSVFGLVMINIVAIDSLRTLAIGAEYGLSLVFYYLLAALIFFLPTALVAAELATGWPESGGIYVWVREAFGKRIGLLTLWLQWIYNVCWYPTIMSFIAATIAYCINPQLADDKLFMLISIFSFFWLCTAINFFGIGASSLMSSISAIIGVILPMFFIMTLGLCWVMMGKPVQIEFSWKNLFPDLSSINHLVLLTGVLFGYVGIEMSAYHAADVKNPQQDYPKAVLWSGIMIFLTLMLSSLAIVIVVPPDQLNVISGLLQAYQIFFSAFNLSWFTPLLALLIICGSLGTVNAWLLGPGRGLVIASQDGCLPTSLSKLNRYQAPYNVLILQGIIFTLLCGIFILLPTVSSSFWALSAITSILSLIVYLFMFAAAIRLRYKYPYVKRAFVIPGGQIGLWLVCLVGILSCTMTLFISFFPPSQIPVGNVYLYEGILVVGVILGCSIPFFLYALTQRRFKSVRKENTNQALKMSTSE